MNNKKLDGVLWVFSFHNPGIMPSNVVGGIMPADILGIKKMIFLDIHDPEKALSNLKPKILIISKAFHDKVIDLIELAKKRKIKIISIFDDWNFDINSKTFNSKRNLPIANNSDVIIVKTKSASEVLYNNTGLVSKVVPDMLRFNTHKLYSKINYPFNLSWFGMHTNHDTLLGELININNTNFKINLKIVTNFCDELKLEINKLKCNNISFEYIDWHPRFDKEIVNSDIVILPYPKDKERLVKSSNRIIDSINLGRFVLLSDVVQFREFKNYTFFGDIAEGLKWLKKNSHLAKNKIQRGQKYIKENYSNEITAKKWKDVIISLL